MSKSQLLALGGFLVAFGGAAANFASATHGWVSLAIIGAGAAAAAIGDSIVGTPPTVK